MRVQTQNIENASEMKRLETSNNLVCVCVCVCVCVLYLNLLVSANQKSITDIHTKNKKKSKHNTKKSHQSHEKRSKEEDKKED